MTLILSIEELEQQLATDKTLLILFGSDEQTLDVYEKAAQMKVNNELAKRHVPLLVKDLGILKPNQKVTWGAAQAKYVVLRVNEAGGRTIISNGSVTKFITVRNEPGKLKIQRAFLGRL